MSTNKQIIGAIDSEVSSVICLDCYRKLEEEFPFIMPDEIYYQADSEGYPDGFTCADCGEVVLPNNYEKGQNK